MAKLVKYTSTLDKTGLQNVTRGWRALDGSAITYGAMAADGGPAPEHTGHDGKPKGVSTNDVLAFIEFGTPTMPERPVIRYVAAAHRRELREAAADVSRAVAQRRAHVPKLHAMGARLVALTKARIQAVSAVDTGQTLRSIHYRLGKRGA
jgi:hypothetical protein